MDLGLRGKTAIVTGGSQGIGEAVARALAGEGVRVAICARTEDQLKQTAQEIERETGVEILPLRADAESDVRALTKRLVREIELRTELIPTTAPGGRGDEPAHTCGT